MDVSEMQVLVCDASLSESTPPFKMDVSMAAPKKPAKKTHPSHESTKKKPAHRAAKPTHRAARRKTPIPAPQPVASTAAVVPVVTPTIALPSVGPTVSPPSPSPSPSPTPTPSPTPSPPAIPPYPQAMTDSSEQQTIAPAASEEEADASPGHLALLHSRKLRVLVGLLMVIGVLFGGVRALPCSLSVGRKTMDVWAVVAPNVVCAIDVSVSPADKNAVLLSHLPDSIGHFSNLQTLDVSGNRLSQLPDSLGSLTKLQSLKAENNLLDTVPASIGQLRALRTLDMRRNALKTLPETLGNLSALHVLLLSDNQLQSLPGSTGQLTALQSLDIERNHIAMLQSTIVQLPNLTQIKTASNDSPLLLLPSSSSSSIASTVSRSSQSSSGSAGSVPDSAQGVQGGSSASTMSASSSATNAPNITNGPLDQTCDHNIVINGYSLCLPAGWVAPTTVTNPMIIHDVNAVPVADVNCPLLQTAYDGWTLQTQSRTYQKESVKYGADLWAGTKTTNGETQSVLVLFLHKNDFASWYGNGYADIGASCQIVSRRPGTDSSAMHTLFTSAF